MHAFYFQVDLDSVNMHSDFEKFDRRHLDVNLLPKDIVDTQRGSTIDYLDSHSSR